MRRPLQLESFSAPKPAAAAEEPRITPDDVEAARLEGYERGYSSGWEDALKSAAEDEGRISEELARNLRDLGFTYHEARAHVIASMEELVEAFIGSFFPEFAAETLALHIAAAVQDDIRGAADEPIIVRVNPNDAAALKAILPQTLNLPLQIDEEPALATGQVHCILGRSEYRIDLARVIEAARGGLAALHEMNERTLKYG